MQPTPTERGPDHFGRRGGGADGPAGEGVALAVRPSLHPSPRHRTLQWAGV